MADYNPGANPENHPYSEYNPNSRTALDPSLKQAAEQARKGGLFGGIGESGVLGIVNSFINTLFGGILTGEQGTGGGLFPNLGKLIGQIFGIKQNVDAVYEVEIPRLQNQIENISSGGVSAVRAYFGVDGVWTKPSGYSRHVVDVIGGGGGGGRANSGQIPGGNPAGLGGYCGGWNQIEFFDGDLPASVAITLGLGGVGATADNQMGTGGGNSNFGAYLSAGGALPTAHGFGSKTMNIRGGSGGAQASVGGINVPYVATAGTGHSYANGGAGGVGNGAAGGNGNSPSPPTLPYPGTGGGGGARNDGPGNGGRGGNGGFPGAPGGGGGAFSLLGFAGNGGNGAPGAVWITSYK